MVFIFPSRAFLLAEKRTAERGFLFTICCRNQEIRGIPIPWNWNCRYDQQRGFSMNRWVSYLLLISIVRLQFVCCCGSIVHLELGYEASAVEQHSHCDSPANSHGSTCCSDHMELSSVPELCLEPCHDGSGCDHGKDGPHQHHLHVLHAAMMPSSQQQSIDRVVLSSLDPFVDTTIAVVSRQSPVLSFATWHLQFFSNVSILTLFGQLRI